MYKIMIYINTYSGDKWFYYQENEKDYVAHSLHEIKETVLTLIDTYGKDNIKIVKQVTGEDMEGSVETFIYDSTDNYEELVNRPSINGVEIIGALSLAELGIQPAGDYATNAKVDELEQAVNNIDLSPYATNERVDQVEAKVDNIDLTPYATNVRVDQVEHKVDNIDLTPYATNARVDQVEAKVDAIDLEPYATMDYLDEVVANIDFSSTNEEISGIKTFSVLPRSAVMPVTEDELTNKSYVDHGVENCASKEYVDTAISNIKIPEVDGYATTEYVDNAIANIDIPEETTETVIFSSADTKEQRKAKFFHLVNLYDSGKKFNAFFKCNAGVSVLGTSFKPDMPTYGFLYSLSFARGGSYNYKYSMSFLVKYIDGSMQSVGDSFAKIELFSKSNDPTQDYNEQCVNVSDSACYYLPRKNELITKTYVDNAVTTLGEHVDEQLANLDISGGDIPEHFYVLDLELPNLYLNNSTTFTSDASKAKLLELFNAIIKNEINRDNVIVILKNSTATNRHYICAPNHQNPYSANKANGITTFQISYWGTYYDGRDLQYSNLYANITVNDTFTEVLKINSAGLNWSYVRLTDHAEKGEVLTKTNTTSFTPTGDYHPATKKYVDDAIASIEIPEAGGEDSSDEPDYPKPFTYAILTNFNKSTIGSSWTNNLLYLNQYKDQLSAFINAAHKYVVDGGNKMSIELAIIFGQIDYTNSSTSPSIVRCYPSTVNNTFFGDEETTEYYFDSEVVGDYQNSSNFVNRARRQFYVQIQGSWTNGVYTCSDARILQRWKINEGLPTNNTAPFTPSADYHPATKKYVDDAVANAGGSGDLSNYYNKEEVDAAISAAITAVLGGEY